MARLDDRRTRHALLALAALGGLAVWSVSETLFPYHSLNHDEGVYLQQTALLLDGQFSLYPPLEGAFRPWFFVEAGDRLYPKYAPVPAALFAVGMALGDPRLSLALVGAAVAGLTGALTWQVFDRRSAVAAAAVVVCSPLFLLNGATFLPYAPTTVLNLAFAVAYLRADRTRGSRWAALAGVAVGLAFFGRPYTAVLFAAPFLVHAAWTLVRDPRRVGHLGVTAALGFGGVVLTLAYNAAVTGDALVFPYEAFAPHDGLGFGRRRLLGHEVRYTPLLALRANAEVVWRFATRWVAGGALGTALALVGLGVAARRDRSARAALLGGVALSVVAGNVYFWGNLNLLGALGVAADGLVAYLGPSYHFDLLVPVAAFAGRAVAAAADAFERRTAPLDADRRRALAAAALLAGAAVFGAATVSAADGPVERNAEVTATYERAYAPFADGAPVDAVVLLPDTYGDWLNHPFQSLRNDPGFDGPTLYALDDRPFAVADAFPDRALYRYTYRGAWAPTQGSPEAARLQRVRDVRGTAVHLRAALGVPAGADGVRVRVATDGGAAYPEVPVTNGTATLDLTVTDGAVRAGNESVPLSGRDTVRVVAFVDYGAAGGFTYRLDVPVSVEGTTRALSPRVEQCWNAEFCAGAAAYVPESAPAGVRVMTRLWANASA